MKKRPSVNGKKPRTTVFNVRLEKRMLDRMRTLAQSEHRTISNLVQVFVSEGVARRSME